MSNWTWHLHFMIWSEAAAMPGMQGVLTVPEIVNPVVGNSD